MAIEVDFNFADIDWWQERDRASVVVFSNIDHDETLWEAWDDDARALVDDGFIKWGDDASVYDYLEEVGILEHVDDEDDDY